MENKDKVLRVQLDSDKNIFCEVPLHQRSVETNWTHVKNIESNKTRISPIILNLQSIQLIEKIEAEKKFQTVYGVIGLAFGAADAVYFLVMCPSDNSSKDTNVFFVARKRPTTKVISNKCCIADLLLARKLDNSDNITITAERTISVDRICRIKILNEYCDFYIVRRDISSGMLLIGVNGVKLEATNREQYDLIVTGKVWSVPPSINQVKRIERKRQRDVDIINLSSVKKNRCDKMIPLAYILPPAVSAEFDSFSTTEVESGVKKKQGFGIKKINGHVRIVPPLGSKYGKFKRDIPLSEMHCTKEVDNAFHTVHSISTITSAIDALEDQIRASNVSVDEKERIIGAVASTLLEDIGWRMGPENDCAQKFKNIKVDIDQVY
jgi:hypothetical protein